MSLTIVKTFTRPDTNTAWYNGSDEKKALMSAQADNGNQISKNTSLSENELTRTTTIVWKDEDVRDVVRNDSIIITHRQNQKIHNDANNISKEIVS